MHSGATVSAMRAEFHEKIWGSTRLAPWFPDSEKKIGEVWFAADEELPVLIKFLFTSERLSVQVHPGDEYAARNENSRGKTEMWRVLRAGAGASVAVGMREAVAPEQLRELAETGRIERHLNWVEVKPGDTIFVPAGTIHAIGPGLALCEIQQTSDVTYRLFDYGRGRELHLDRSLEVADLSPYRAPAKVEEGYVAHCPYFAVREWTVRGSAEVAPDPGRFELLVAMEGEGRIAGEPFRLGQVWHVPAGAGRFMVTGEGRFLRVHVPG